MILINRFRPLDIVCSHSLFIMFCLNVSLSSSNPQQCLNGLRCLGFSGHENIHPRCFSLSPLAVLLLFIAALHQRSKALGAVLITLPGLRRPPMLLGAKHSWVLGSEWVAKRNWIMKSDSVTAVGLWVTTLSNFRTHPHRTFWLARNGIGCI